MRCGRNSEGNVHGCRRQVQNPDQSQLCSLLFFSLLLNSLLLQHIHSCHGTHNSRCRVVRRVSFSGNVSALASMERDLAQGCISAVLVYRSHRWKIGFGA